MEAEEIIGFEALYNSMRKCIRGVLWKDGVASFYHNWIREILRLTNQLHDGTYKERPAKFFTVTEPKTREIMSIAFRDRVYQRSLNDVAIYPATTRTFIYDNYACQKGKGTDFARDRLKEQLRRYYRKHGAEGYVLQCDIKGYYPNMRHDVAKEVLRKYLDDNIYQMAEAILDNFPGEVGFNPGSQIIQIVGITALSEMDHMIKEKLHMEQYGRYMDDFEMIDESRERLEHALEVISEYLKGRHMELNRDKTRIYRIKEGIPFLGFIFRLTDSGKVVVTIKPEKIKHERRKLRRMVIKARKGEKTREQVDEHFRSWKASASYGNSFKMLQRMEVYYKSLWEDDQNESEQTDDADGVDQGKAKRGSDGREGGTAGGTDRVHGDHDRRGASDR